MGIPLPLSAARPCSNRWLVAAISLVVTIVGGSWTSVVHAQSLRALTTFGSNGWLYPGSAVSGTLNIYAGGTNSNSNRGLAWNPLTNNLVVPIAAASTGTAVAILDGLTGTTVRTMNITGVSGGSAVLAAAGVGDDGQIYVANLAVGSAATFKVYAWGSDASTLQPTTAYQKILPTTSSGTFRFGDAFAIFGSGANTRFAAAGSTSTGTTNGSANNSNFMYGTVNSSSTSTIYHAIPVPADPGNNNYRLGITFVDSDTVIGTLGSRGLLTDFVQTSNALSATDATITGTIPFPTASSRHIDQITIDGKSYLAVGDSSSNVVRVLDISTPTSPVTVAFRTLTTSTFSNANGTGQMAWGQVSQPAPESPWYYEVNLYSLNTNNGIQAMIFSVPEPAAWAMLATGAVTCSGVACSRFRRRRRAA